MTIFVETVLFENLIVDGFLLWLVQKSLKERAKWQNILVSATFGSVFALLSVNLALSGFFAIALKFLVAFLMCLALSFTFRHIFQKFLLFLFYTFCFGGLLFCICFLMEIPMSFKNALIYDFNLPLGAILAIFCAFVITCFALLKRFFRRQKVEKFCYDLKLSICGKNLDLKGFLDTGNTVFDSKQCPVLILNQNYLKNFVSAKEYGKIQKMVYEKVNVKSVSGNKVISLIKPESCFFNGKNKNVAIGICDDELFSANDFDIILNPKMLEA